MISVKKLTLRLLFIAAVFLVAWLLLHHQSKLTFIENIEKNDAVKIQIPNKHPSKKVDETVQKKAENEILPSLAIIKKMTSPWHLANEEGAHPRHQLNKVITESSVVNIESAGEFPKIGDQILLPLLNGQEAVAQVESITVHPNGERSWEGKLADYSNSYPVKMDYSENMVFGKLNTPNGDYYIRTENDVGWIYKIPPGESMNFTASIQEFKSKQE